MIKLRRPESHEEEAHCYIGREHRCQAAALKLQVEGREKYEADGGDAILFPVGHYGSGLPGNVPFEVVSTEPCPACGVYVKTLAMWVTPTVIDLGSKLAVPE